MPETLDTKKHTHSTEIGLWGTESECDAHYIAIATGFECVGGGRIVGDDTYGDVFASLNGGVIEWNYLREDVSALSLGFWVEIQLKRTFVVCFVGDLNWIPG